MVSGDLACWLKKSSPLLRLSLQLKEDDQVVKHL